MLALARYAGLRRHELSIQRWDDIDVPNARMTISSTKTGTPTSRRDAEGRPILIRRDVPIFRELMPHIIRAKEMAPADQELLQPSYPREMNLDKPLARCIARAGLQSWDKPWQNMRATRQTELLDQGYQICKRRSKNVAPGGDRSAVRKRSAFTLIRSNSRFSGFRSEVGCLRTWNFGPRSAAVSSAVN